MIQAEKLKKFIPAFQKFLSAEGGKWKKEREDKDTFFAKYFSKDQIDKLDEGTLRELIHILWAFNGWTNKDWLHEQMLLKSGLPAIRSAFKNLLYGTESLAKRFDGVRKSIFHDGCSVHFGNPRSSRPHEISDLEQSKPKGPRRSWG